ncbi:AMP-binding protein [Roseospira marina]|uniref:AMP-binding protein n=1 Tax=Roseospira marina TaxID=140057 RepID=A0A5M6IEH6_9PROT|nr:acyl--CoA ligase [Roseospira marina]KAA5606681.1 AMP-binding protein [Roseospira marina]MBB4313907.1 acyl-CoA synthetase (AMP-forming)/AMP-acid ligase II [Roseospira marina]MBB5087069.1 acyl-CoA synthetase (AMP-forming)/AMP-acid ligase II [Roseospira marina]
MSDTVRDLLRPHDPDSLAIGALDRPWLTFGGLNDLADATMASLNAMGVGRGDRVAIVLPNGPEMATAFITLAGCCDTAPLNPSYKEDEYDFYMSDLGAKLLVVAEGDDGPAVSAARRHGIRIARLSVPEGAAAGVFTLAAEDGAGGTAANPGPSGPDDGALVLHTSGTTSRPKIVPLLNRNVAASARHIGAILNLTPADRCLNIMPLFHIHGLIAAVTTSLAQGASVWCSPGFNALQIFTWMDTAEPTWYTAVPTMHQAILSRAPRNKESVARAKLRLIRSSSSSLPPQVMTALEDTFGCPVIESYGMTEATHQMTSNPLPPAEHKAGSVGLPAGPAVRTAHETENELLAPGAIGEVVISGPNVTPGYESNPAANEKAFFEAEGQRWFRTGDQGQFDSDGYLRITGRLKEIINRGGEKISPLEVDDVLMDHPAVQQVVTFGMPHPKLGEEVAAAVVLREGQTAGERDLRDFAADRLADFKVPRKVIILDEIPKGATGKLQRIGLAEKLGVSG